jgi:hypothetical protein
MSLAEDLQLDVNDVLDDPDFGRDVTLRKVIPGAYDATTGGTAAATTTNTATRGMLLGYRDSQINGTTIQRGDRKCIMKVPNNVTPEVSDRLVVGAETLSVVDVRRVALGEDGTVIVYILQVRK